MTEAQIKLIIDSILNGAIIYNWKLYLVIFLVSLVSAAITALVKSYFFERARFKAINDSLNTVKDQVLTQEKAKYQAIEENLEIIKKQVEATTEASETIKIALDHDNWRKKELETIKRQKIEDYFEILHSLRHKYGEEILNTLIETNYSLRPTFFDKSSTIQMLYIPEVKNEHRDLEVVVAKLNYWIQKNKRINPSPKNEAELHLTEDSIEEIRKILNSLKEKIKSVSLKIKIIASELNS